MEATLDETNGKLEGTSTIEIKRNGGAWNVDDPLNWPITATITRTDGITNTTINPTQPYSQAGSYGLAIFDWTVRKEFIYL